MHRANNIVKRILFLLFLSGSCFALHSKAQSVYVAGFENNLYNDVNVSVARYWKDGTPVSLTDGKLDAYCKSVFVADGNVYMAGSITNAEGSNQPVYWVNNSAVVLNSATASAFANSVYVKNGLVCVSNESNGWKPVETHYWFNNTPVSLKQDNAIIAVKSVFIGDDKSVYATGTRIIGKGDGFIYPVAAYWKDGKEILLAEKNHESLGQSIFVSDKDVYVAGYETSVAANGNYVEGYVATYWKNGKAFHLSEKTKTNYATSVFVANGDVYVAGYERQIETGKDIAKYWKNGEEFRLTDGTFHGRANAIFVHQTDVYVAGEINPEPDIMKLATSETGINKIAVYWKNGKLVALTDKKFDASAAGIFVQ